MGNGIILENNRSIFVYTCTNTFPKIWGSAEEEYRADCEINPYELGLWPWLTTTNFSMCIINMCQFLIDSAFNNSSPNEETNHIGVILKLSSFVRIG